MTTIRQIIDSINLSKNGETIHGSENLPSVFGIHEYVPFDERIKFVFVRPHYCTDSWVGVRAYFLDGDFVCLSTQVGRKWDEEFQFVSQEAAQKVKDYIVSLIPEPKFNINIISKLDSLINDFYFVVYAEQILHKSGIYNGEKVKIKRLSYNDPRREKDAHSVIVVEKNGEEKLVDCRDVKLAYIDLS